MTVAFYNYAGNARQIGKNLTGGSDFTCNPYRVVSNMDMSIILDYNASFEGANMAVVDGQAYFITSTEKAPAGQLIVNLHKDVLTIYADAIKGCAAVCARSGDSQNSCNFYITDGRQELYTERLIDHYTLGTFNFSNDVYILVTAG